MQFGNGWFVSYGCCFLLFFKCRAPSMLQLGLTDVQRDWEMSLDRWEIRRCFLGEKTDSRCLWILTKPESVLPSEGAEDQRLLEPSSLNLSLNLLISSGVIQVVGCLKEQEKCTFNNSCYKDCSSVTQEPELLNLACLCFNLRNFLLDFFLLIILLVYVNTFCRTQ